MNLSTNTIRIIDVTPKEGTPNTVLSNNVRNIVRLTQTEYDALPTKDATTLYLIIEE